MATENTKKLSKNTSINFESDIFQWLDEESARRGVNRSKLINNIVRERMETRPSGFKADIEWIMGEHLHPGSHVDWKEEPIPEDIQDFDAIYSIHRLATDDSHQDALAGYIILVENTREGLRRLFADAMLFHLNNGNHPILLMIPYKLDPDNKVWKGFSQFEPIQVRTPEKLVPAVNRYLLGKK